jgi:hypothetical protein
MTQPPTPEKRAETQGKDEKILRTIPDRTRKAEAPEELRPTGQWATPAAIVQDFQKIREQQIAYLADTNDDLRSHLGASVPRHDRRLSVAALQRRPWEASHRADSRGQGRPEFPEEVSGRGGAREVDSPSGAYMVRGRADSFL